MRDTSPEMMEKMREMIRMKSPLERLMMGCSMYATSKYLVIRAIREENPDISEAALRRQFFLRFYGNDFNPEEREKIAKHLEQCT